MFIQGHYIITSSFMYMIGHYDRYGNPFTQIVETDRTIFINKSPIEVLAYSLRCTGFTLDGAIESSKWIMKMDKMVPVVANPYQEVILFPTRSLTHVDNIWFNPYHISRTSNIKGKTLIILSNHSSLYIPTRLTSFNTKIQTAEQLKKMTTEAANGTSNGFVEDINNYFYNGKPITIKILNYDSIHRSWILENKTEIKI